MAGAKKWGVITAVLLFAPLLVYWPTWNFDFVTFDDGIHIYRNKLLNPPTWEGLRRLWQAPYQGLYVPLTYTVWAALSAVAYAADHASPVLFHAANVILHTINGGLVCCLLRAMGIAWAPALAATLFFVWHPLQVEPVAWISSLKDLLCSAFVLLALWQYVRFAKLEPGRRRVVAYLVSIAAFFLAILAKPAAIVFPLMAAVIDLAVLRRDWKSSWPAWLPWVWVALPVAWLTKSQQPDIQLDFVPAWYQRVLLAGDALVFYLSKTLFPFALSLNYGRTPERVLQGRWVLWIAVLPLLVGALAWRRRRESQRWLAGFLLFVVYLLPVLGLVPFYYQKYSTVADRFAYLALVGPALILGSWLASASRAGWVVTGVTLGFFGCLSSAQTEMWRDNRSFIRQVARVNAGDADIQYSLGIVLAEESQPPGQGSFYSHLLRLRPTERDEVSRKKRHDEAVHHFQQALRLNPRHAPAHNNLGILFQRTGELRQAEWHFREAGNLEPKMGEAFNNLGVVLAELGDIRGALSAFSRAVELSPGDASAAGNLARAKGMLSGKEGKL